MHITQEITSDDLPPECIEDCSASGDVSIPVAYWADRLEITVDRDAAIAYLTGMGAWGDAELEAMSDSDLAHKILWISCCDFAEGQDLVVLE